MKINHLLLIFSLFIPAQHCLGTNLEDRPATSGSPHDDLVLLFKDWREFEHPGFLDGAPDYTALNMARQHAGLDAFVRRLESIDTDGWTASQMVDWHLVRAEMNGLDFNIRVLKPWQRDPAFYTSVWSYQSDTPAHEGPTHHAPVELWTYTFPLSSPELARLESELASIAPLLKQARKNLSGNARELWIAGIRNITDQADELEALAGQTMNAPASFSKVLNEATGATKEFAAWLAEQQPYKTGPSGIGKENYTWYLQNVHLVPMTWEEEVSLLERELARAHANLRLEEHRNRSLPPITPISSAEEYESRAEEAVLRFTRFLREQEILPDYDYIEPALRAHTMQFVPEESRNFFHTVAHHELLALWTHWYHWFDLARMQSDPHPSPIRSGPLLYNIFDSRSEGMATGFEEMMMHAGLYDGNPRARELVYIMLAQRAARGLGSLYVHSNRFTMQQARDFHVERTPRGWMREDLDLLGFEQLLYLRQPGYGSSYVTGKYLIEELIAERAAQLGDEFNLRAFLEEFDRAGVIPVSLIRLEMTGHGDEVLRLKTGE